MNLLRRLLRGRVPPPLVHEHHFFVAHSKGGVRVLDCECGARRKVALGTEGWYELPYVPGPTSLDNVLFTYDPKGPY